MIASDDPPVPDLITPIEAYRCWRITPGSLTLVALNEELPWARRRWTVARCHALRFKTRFGSVPELDPDPLPHATSPEETCTCGLYASKTLDKAVEMAWATSLPIRVPAGEDVETWSESLVMKTSLVGRVHLAGKVIEHDRGYRAQYARVVELLPFPGQEPTAERIGRAYGAAVTSGMVPRLPPKQWQRLRGVIRIYQGGGGRSGVVSVLPAMARTPITGWRKAGLILAGVVLKLLLVAGAVALMVLGSWAIVPGLIVAAVRGPPSWRRGETRRPPPRGHALSHSNYRGVAPSP